MRRCFRDVMTATGASEQQLSNVPREEEWASAVWPLRTAHGGEGDLCSVGDVELQGGESADVAAQQCKSIRFDAGQGRLAHDPVAAHARKE